MSNEWMAGLAGLAALAALVAAWAALRLLAAQTRQQDESQRLERALREEAAQSRRESAEIGAQQRRELSESLSQFSRVLGAQHEALASALNARLDSYSQGLDAALRRLDERSQTLLSDARAGRGENAQTLQQFGEALVRQLNTLGENNAQRVLELRQSVETRLQELQTDNATKLEAMRATVDERLHATLEQRLGESFRQVAERLEQVHRGLGEMQNLAAGVGDLNRMLTGVKSRGIWGEIQLGALLEQVLTPQQFERDVATRRGSSERVEYAIRLPGRDTGGESVWLPIDAKFPREDYERLLDAQERGDQSSVEDHGKQLETRIKQEARSIRDKYIDPPHTTDFALLFLPAEGLYAEVLRRPGLAELLQRDYRVTIAGPTTLTALLNSLQMGFRTLAIERRSSEVWEILGAVKTEFGKFGTVLDKVKKKLDEASNQIDETGRRSRAIERRLRTVEALPNELAAPLLGTAGSELAGDDEQETSA